MKRWDDLPTYFVQDSIDREVFKPEGQVYCSPEQMKVLLADAEFYTEPDGPDQVFPGLKLSALAVIRHIKLRLHL